jgi:hypothetical protein
MAIRDGFEDMIAFLNELLAVDAPAIQYLLSARVACGAELADHPTVQVGYQRHTDPSEARTEIGVLGLLNGFYGVYATGDKAGWGPITAFYEDGRLVRFSASAAEKDTQA